MPASVTPRRMNGATVAGKSMRPASPQAVTTPPSLSTAGSMGVSWVRLPRSSRVMSSPVNMRAFLG